MAEMIAYCGLDCSRCPAYRALRYDDDELRSSTAEQWSEEFGTEFEPEDINCSGCASTDEPKVGYCSECPIRLCAMDRGLGTCAECRDYPCRSLLDFFDMVPDARKKLESLRQS